MTKNLKIEGFILAGGKSSRLGVDKALLKFKNKAFLEIAFDALTNSCCGNVSVVLNNESQLENASAALPNVLFVFDEHKNRGALGGIHAALKNSESEWTFVLACDLPLVSSEIVLRIAEKSKEINPGIAAIVPQQTDGRLQPLCAMYKTQISLPTIEQMFTSHESVSVRDIIANVPHIVVGAYELDENIPERLFININTPEDYKSIVN